MVAEVKAALSVITFAIAAVSSSFRPLLRPNLGSLESPEAKLRHSSSAALPFLCFRICSAKLQVKQL